jgi:MFS family permease
LTTLATRTLIATTAIQAAVACAAMTVPSIAPVIAADIGVPASTVGTYVSLLYVGAAVAALAGSSMVLRYGAIRLSQVCLLICALGLIATLAIGVPGWALAVAAVSAVLIGAGYGPITPASSHVLARTTPPGKMAFTFSVKQTGVPAGVALAGLVVPPLTVAFGWPVALAVIAVGCLAIAVASQPLRAPLDVDRDRKVAISPRALMSGLALVTRVPGLPLMATVSFFYSGMQMSVSAFIVAYLHTEIGMGLLTAGVALTVANVAGVVGRLGWGAVSDRTAAPRATLAVIGFAMAAASVAAAAITPAWPAILVHAVAAVLGATAIGWNGVYLSEVARRAPPGEAARATGGCLFFTFVGVIVMPFAFGWLQRATGSYSASFVAAAAVCLAIALVLAVGGRSARGTEVR